MTNDNLRKIRNKLIMQMCLRRTHGDEDAARYVREDACVQVTTRTRGELASVSDYKVLLLDELQHLINYIQKGVLPEQQVQYASQKKLGLLHRIAINCAIHYAPFPPIIDRNGEVLSDDAIRNNIATAIKDRKRVADVYQKCMYDWIVPKIAFFFNSYEFTEGDKTPLRKQGEFLQWDRITDRQAQYLINRFTAMLSEIKERYDKKPMLYSFSEN